MMDWLDIPGNEHVCEELETALSRRQVIAFVGDMAATGLCPVGDQLFEALAEQVRRRELASSSELNEWSRMYVTDSDRAHAFLKARLDRFYEPCVRDQLQRRYDADLAGYTRVQELAMQIPFRGWISGYPDTGLLQARMRCHPNSIATGFGTWKDDIVYDWLDGSAFQKLSFPILYAHGIQDRGDTIRITKAQRRELYAEGPYSRMFQNLWDRERLCFLGCEWEWLEFVSRVVENAGEYHAGRHFSIVGIDNGMSSPDGLRHVRQELGRLGMAAILYIKDKSDVRGDIEGICRILEYFQEPRETSPVAMDEVVDPPPDEEGPTECWVHSTTQDSRFVGRPEVFSTLNRWVRDPDVRVIAINGMGGIGKTSLIGHWIASLGGKHGRSYRGLFFWSFYADSGVQNFVESLSGFAEDLVKGGQKPQVPARASRILSLIQQESFLVILDGLEVLQESPGTFRYGALVDPELRTILDGGCRVSHNGLIVLTSRFPFADLEPHLGRGYRMYGLNRLSNSDGAKLLALCGLGGAEETRMEIVDALGGHPLGLRVYASAAYEAGDFEDSDPCALLHQLYCSGLREDDALERKLHHLLGFYASRLPPLRVELLGLISLFRNAVAEETVCELGSGLNLVEGKPDFVVAAMCRDELEVLADENLLIGIESDDAVLYDCHPILRDHFRELFLGRDNVESMAAVILERPSTLAITSVRELEPVLVSVNLLLQAGNLAKANELYMHRLDQGKIFMDLPALDLGVLCVQSLCETAEGCSDVHIHLGRYYNDAGLLSWMCGDLARSEQYLNKAEVWLDEHDVDYGLSLATCLVNRVGVAEARGNLASATDICRSARAKMKGISRNLCRLNICEASVLLNIGKVYDAWQLLSKSLRLREDFRSDEYGAHGVGWAVLSLRLGRSKEAEAINKLNWDVCKDQAWVRDVARCEWIHGWIRYQQGDLRGSLSSLRAAEQTLRMGFLHDLLPVLVVRGLVELRSGRFQAAQAAAGEALRSAAQRGMRLSQIDALLLRSRIWFDMKSATELERANDDAEAALQLALRCRYAWGKRDAYNMLARVAKRKKDLGREQQMRLKHEKLAKDLRLEVPFSYDLWQ